MRDSAIVIFFGRGVVVAAVLASAGLAQVTSERDAVGSPTRLSPRQHGPVKIHGWRPENQVDSENWSGYAVTGSGFTQVTGSWIVPAVNCTETPATRSSNVYSSFWVGIDGYNSNTVEQIGTDSDCDYNGRDESSVATYYAWYEFYPAGSREISLTISPGDQMSAEVSYNGSEFTVTIKDVTAGTSYSKTETVRGAQRSSAEWIAESPCCTRSGGFLPLSDFGTVSFGEDYTRVSGTNYATDSSTSGPISAFGIPCTETVSSNCVAQINMVTSSGAVEDNSASLSGDGTSFQVVWVSE